MAYLLLLCLSCSLRFCHLYECFNAASFRSGWRGTRTQIATTLTACAAAKPGSKLKRDAPKQAETLLRDIGGVLESEYRCMVTARDPVSDELIATYRG